MLLGRKWQAMKRRSKVADKLQVPIMLEGPCLLHWVLRLMRFTLSPASL
jgi:hypothetical protein